MTDAPTEAQAAADHLAGLEDRTPDGIYRATQGFSDRALAVGLTTLGGGGGSLPDPITEVVNMNPASTSDTWVLSTMVPDGLTSSIAFGNAVWDDTDPNGCGEIGGQENG